MFPRWLIFLSLVFIFSTHLVAEEHSHAAPEKPGSVSFPISCRPAVQEQFDRGIALLHSFAYTAAENVFRSVAEHDSRCAMAHWGMAMTYFHELCRFRGRDGEASGDTGAIVPAREQLGKLLLEQNQPRAASKEFDLALANAPGRRGALQGAQRAAKLSRQ